MPNSTSSATIGARRYHKASRSRTSAATTVPTTSFGTPSRAIRAVYHGHRQGEDKGTERCARAVRDHLGKVDAAKTVVISAVPARAARNPPVQRNAAPARTDRQAKAKSIAPRYRRLGHRHDPSLGLRKIRTWAPLDLNQFPGRPK